MEIVKEKKQPFFPVLWRKLYPYTEKRKIDTTLFFCYNRK